MISACRKQARPFPRSTRDATRFEDSSRTVRGQGAHAPWTKLALGKKSQPTDESECNSGDVTEKVTWPHLPIGSEIQGTVHNIRDTWLAFDGRVPHVAMPLDPSSG